MTCCFFGHRQVPGDVRPKLVSTMECAVRDKRITEFLVGHQGAFDRMVFAELRLLKKKYPHISYSKILSSLPKKEEDEVDDWQELYFPEEVAKSPPRFAIAVRNRWMISQSNLVIAYMTNPYGGTGKFVSLAQSKGKEVINLAEWKE